MRSTNRDNKSTPDKHSCSSN